MQEDLNLKKISQSATICRIFLGGKLARSRSSSSSTQDEIKMWIAKEDCRFIFKRSQKGDTSLWGLLRRRFKDSSC